MVFLGFFASPAVKPIISKPPKANMMSGMAITNPLTPFGKKPPWLHRLLTAAPSGVAGPNRSQPPRAIIIMTATTLMVANQNSASPKIFTLRRFSPLMSAKKNAAQVQVGISGHQNWMYLPTAVNSAMPTRM
ncbi:hypothetical protein FQZ97_498700 [compost metagenome]